MSQKQAWAVYRGPHLAGWYTLEVQAIREARRLNERRRDILDFVAEARPFTVQTVDGKIYGPISIEPADDRDQQEQAQLDKTRAAIATARAFGLSEEDLDVIRRGDV